MLNINYNSPHQFWFQNIFQSQALYGRASFKSSSVFKFKFCQFYRELTASQNNIHVQGLCKADTVVEFELKFMFKFKFMDCGSAVIQVRGHDMWMPPR